MELNWFSIKNFRSIKKLDIIINDISSKKCSIFFGVNETGKSNILKAVSYLDNKKIINYEIDCNKEAKKKNEEIVLRFYFKITEEDKEISQAISNLDLPSQLLSQIKIVEIEKVISFNKESVRVEDHYFHFQEGIKFDEFTYDETQNKIIVKDLTEKNQKPDLTDEQLDRFILQQISEEIIINGFPEVIFWEASNKYLINDPIDLNEFKRNPDISIPLKNIFELAGYKDDILLSNITRIQNNIESRSEFNKVLSKITTNHINLLWPEHKIKINVFFDGPLHCSVFVEDKDNEMQIFSMSQRSDGFKQFVSILLNLSVENKTNALKNKIILLDEPEVHLHPSSIKYLRNELLNISKNNIVLLASQSIYMVDRKNLGRHYTVSKEKGLTIIEQVDPENPIREEVIYESLGTSIFEIIEPNMIIFEGRIDKDLFESFTNKFKNVINPENIRSISSNGTKNMHKYVKFFNNKLVSGFIVVDSDNEGKMVKKNIQKEDLEFLNNTFEIKDLIEIDKKVVVLEDLFPEEIVLLCAKKLYNYEFNSPGKISILDHIKNIKKEQKILIDGKLEELKKLIIHEILNDLKNLKINEIEKKYNTYITFIKNLHKKIKE